MHAIERQCQLRLHQSIRNPRVIPLSLRGEDPIFIHVLPQMLLGGRELNLAFFSR